MFCMKYIVTAVMVSMLFLQCSTANKMSAAELAKIETMVKEHKFIFEAESITPMRSQRKFLNSGYQVTVNRDTISADLPFIGRAQMAPVGRDESGTFFTTTNFTYKYTAENKNNWRITLDINDQKFTRQIIINVFANGKASLDVYSNFRDPTNFSGHIRAIKE